MKSKQNQYRNMIDDPYLYRECCGGVTLAADGTKETVKEITLQSKAVVIATSIVILVGIVVTSNWAYNRFIK